MKLYTALDVSLRSVAICVVDEQGEVLDEAKTDAIESVASTRIAFRVFTQPRPKAAIDVSLVDVCTSFMRLVYRTRTRMGSAGTSQSSHPDQNQ